MDGGSDERGSPGSSGGGGLLRLEEFLLAVGGLGALVGLTEERCHDCEGGGMVEYGAEGDGRRLNWR